MPETLVGEPGIVLGSLASLLPACLQHASFHLQPFPPPLHRLSLLRLPILYTLQWPIQTTGSRLMVALFHKLGLRLRPVHVAPNWNSHLSSLRPLFTTLAPQPPPPIEEISNTSARENRKEEKRTKAGFFAVSGPPVFFKMANGGSVVVRLANGGSMVG